MALHRIFASEPFVFDLTTPVSLGETVAWGCEPDGPESGWGWNDGVSWEWRLLSPDPESDHFMDDAEPDDAIVQGKLVSISELRAAYRQDSHGVWTPASYRVVEQTSTRSLPDRSRSWDDDFVAYVFGVESER